FIYRPLAGKHPGAGRITLACVTAAVIGLQMGAFTVVLETTASGISALPFAQFVELMLPIHLAIGAVEGLATAAVVIFISKAQPSLLRPADLETGTVKKASWTVLGIFAVAALLCGAALSWFASAYPDGLEWSVAGVTGSEETRLAEPSPLHRNLETVQEATAIMPDYAFPADDGANTAETEAASSIVNPETSMAGVLGSVMIAALIFASGFLFGRKPHSRCPR
ncbi:MAG: PDGLE domain-containing protein, partial [Akkermansia sp.]|nr:PDGLE domain-containing protein [Akkermansia sp.]